MKIVKPNAQRQREREREGYINYTSCHHVYKHLYIETIYTSITVFIARAAAAERRHFDSRYSSEIKSQKKMPIIRS